MPTLQKNPSSNIDLSRDQALKRVCQFVLREGRLILMGDEGGGYVRRYEMGSAIATKALCSLRGLPSFLSISPFALL